MTSRGSSLHQSLSYSSSSSSSLLPPSRWDLEDRPPPYFDQDSIKSQKNDDNMKLQLAASCQTLDQAWSCLLIFCITTLSLYQFSYLPLKYICIVFPITLNLFAQTHCVPGSLRERRWGWEALMGKWASSFSPPLESSIKASGEAQQQSQAWAKLIKHMSETHDDDDFIQPK